MTSRRVPFLTHLGIGLALVGTVTLVTYLLAGPGPTVFAAIVGPIAYAGSVIEYRAWGVITARDTARRRAKRNAR